MDYNMQNDETEIDLKRLMYTMINRWRFIIILGVIGAILIGLFTISTLKKPDTSFFESEVIPYYESSTTMELVFRDENTQQSGAVLELARSQTVFNQVIKKMELDTTLEELREMIRVSIEGGNNLYYLKIKALDEDATIAKEIAERVRGEAIGFITKSIDDLSYYRVIEQPNLPDEPTLLHEIEEDEEIIEKKVVEVETSNFKKLVTRVIMGGILGVFIAIFIIFIQFALNDNIQTPEDVERYLGKRVLASIPLIDGKYRVQGDKSNGRN